MKPRPIHLFLFTGIFIVFASAASALQVTVTYSLTGTLNTTPLLGGQNPTGGTAIIVWPLTSLYGRFDVTTGNPLFPSLVSPARVAHLTIRNSYGTITISPFTFMPTLTHPFYYPSPHTRAFWFTHLIPPNLWLPTTRTDHTRDRFNFCAYNVNQTRAGTAFVNCFGTLSFGFWRLPTTNTQPQTHWDYFPMLGLRGQEVARVPEPSTFTQIAVGVIGLAALAAAARRRHRRG